MYKTNLIQQNSVIRGIVHIHCKKIWQQTITQISQIHDTVILIIVKFNILQSCTV